MFGTIRKHQTWLWAVIITLTIISFVIFFSPSSQFNRDDARDRNLGSIHGKKISEEDLRKAHAEVRLRYFMMSGRWPDEDARRMGFDDTRETYQWMFITQKAEQMGIHPSIEAVEKEALQMLAPFQRMGITSPSMFFQEVLARQNITAADFERFVRSYLAVQELISVVGVGGKLVPPQEAAALYVRENQELATEAVFFSASNYLASVNVTPEALAEYFTNHLANYRIPDRVQIRYVAFAVSNHLAAAEAELSKTNLNEMVEASVQRLGTNTFKEAKTPEETRTQVRAEIIRLRALNEARRQAAAWADPLFNEGVPAEEMDAHARKHDVPVHVSAPFTREDGPAEIEAGPEVAKAAFSLSPEQPFAGPFPGEDAVYLIGFHKKIDSEAPPFEQVRERVTEDYKRGQAMTLARQAGAAAHAALTNAIATNNTFEAACADAKLKPESLPPFALSTRSLPGVEDKLPLNQLKQIAFSTPVGEVSPFQPTMEGGIILHVKSKLPVDQDKMKNELPGFTEYVRQTRQQEAFNDWFRREADRGLRDTPLARPPAPNMAPGNGKS